MGKINMINTDGIVINHAAIFISAYIGIFPSIIN